MEQTPPPNPRTDVDPPAEEAAKPPAEGTAEPPSAAQKRWGQIAVAIAWTTLATIVLVVMAPWLGDFSTFGFHDWDAQTSHRYLALDSLVRYHEFPGWNPFACGGYPAWGYVEADTVLVSPWLPAYLALPIAAALRVEVLGQALIGAVGAHVLAGLFTRSRAARALVAALWAVDGRWGLQAAAGHTWHLSYAWMPWCFYFYEKARARGGRARDVMATSACLAMLVYSGGIYPLPHTVLLLGLYALAMAVAERSLRPVVVLAGSGLAAVGLAAPKLFPMIDTFLKSPRLIESNETLSFTSFLVMLTSRDQGFFSRPARVSPYGWHEWGIYIGVAGLGLLVLGFFLARGRREIALAAIGALYVVLGFGAFHPLSPWTLLHDHVPMFRSQHVPSRFLYTAVLLLSLVTAAGLGRLIERASARRPWVDALAGVLVLAIGVDVASVAAQPMASAMWMEPPKIPEGRSFHFEKAPPFQYKKRDWAGPMYLAMLGNTGVLDCYGTPPFDRKGALARTDKRYRGEAYVDGEGSATVVDFSPNRAVLDVTAAADGARVFYNMNFDEGWSAEITGQSGARALPVENQGDVLSVVVPAGAARVTFAYSPPWIRAGLLAFALTAAGLAVHWLRERRAARRESLS